MKKVHMVITLFLLLVLTSCKTDEEAVDRKMNNKEDLLYLNKDNESVIVSKKMEMLNESHKVASTSSGDFTKVLSFVPNDEYIKKQSVRGDEISYLKLPISKSTMSGKLIYENNTKDNITVQPIFLQGNDNILIKPSSSSKWVPSILYDVPPHTSITINIDLKWGKNGMQELTFFPLEKTSDVYRYNGSILSSYRFFAQSEDINLTKEMLQDQSFSLEQNKMTSEQNYFPEPDWIGENNNALDYLIKKDSPLTSDKINGLKFDAVPYNTTFDLLLVDEFGNSSLLKEDVKIKKNKTTYVALDQTDLNKMYKKSIRQFIFIMNNREEKIMADIKAVELNIKPFPTTYQRVIEFYKSDK
ncbi:hypothetical protein [Bacillus sp. V2I10]|uniref:hypothetical protein n=1 Tax=Bacillus sp. V2I10 TaxID=3042276 RepID=UPI00278066F6|nr:hypothetical protein [Bacillus sp. V2I10]MDQ0859825.1 hypothetical protein [Bacillus sp. V2I10]